MAKILRHFEALVNKGLKVIPLYENSKVPMYKNWNKNWEYNFVREKIERFPRSNIGVLLGEIIDVEGDSESANDIIIKLIKDYPHPFYKSNKSIHHLFLNPKNSIRHFKWQEIEFRGHGHQSVLPPSKVKLINYKWLKNFKFPIPPMPEELLKFLERKKNKNKYKNKLKPSHIKIRCIACEETVFLHKKRYENELVAFKILNEKWQCKNCRNIDLKSACRLIRSGVGDEIVKNCFQKK
jgi:hypothetical protein